MTNGIRRGLGLVVIALITYLLGLAMSANDVDTLASVLILVTVVCGFVGLTLIAWGLLRD